MNSLLGPFLSLGRDLCQGGALRLTFKFLLLHDVSASDSRVRRGKGFSGTRRTEAANPNNDWTREKDLEEKTPS